MKKWILLIFLGALFSSCKTHVSEDRKIRKTVNEFLNATKENNIDKYKDLIYKGEEYSGGIHMEQIFFSKNFEKINSIVDLKKNIKIKDTIWSGTKMKYVQYYIKGNNPQKPLIITYIFNKSIGYHKIVNAKILRNMLDWVPINSENLRSVHIK